VIRCGRSSVTEDTNNRDPGGQGDADRRDDATDQGADENAQGQREQCAGDVDRAVDLVDGAAEASVQADQRPVPPYDHESRGGADGDRERGQQGDLRDQPAGASGALG